MKITTVVNNKNKTPITTKKWQPPTDNPHHFSKIVSRNLGHRLYLQEPLLYNYYPCKFFWDPKIIWKTALDSYTVWVMNTECEISTLISITMMVIEGGEINTNIWIGVLFGFVTPNDIFEEKDEEILWWQLDWRTTEQLVWREQWQRIWRLLVSSICAHYYQKLSYKPSKKSEIESSKGSKLSYCSEYYNLTSYAIFECAKYNQYNINFVNTICTWPDSAKIFGLVTQLSKVSYTFKTLVISWSKVFPGVSFVLYIPFNLVRLTKMFIFNTRR